MATSSGFWSYVHADDAAENGRITDLLRDVVAQYELITGESIALFHDRDQLEWGDEWAAKIDSALSVGAFFIPIVTPRYFQSRECRRELSSFARKAQHLGIRELIMPIRYINFPAFDEETCADELIVLARSFQWECWTELRFSARDSPEYRRAVASLADRLARAAASMEKTTVPESAAQITDDEEDDDAPGFIDKLASIEQVMPDWAQTVTEIGSNIEIIGVMMQDATNEVEHGDARGKGAVARVVVARNLATMLEEPTEKTRTLANRFAAQLNEIDLGIHAILERAPVEFHERPESSEELVSLTRALRALIENAEEGLGSAEGMATAVASIEQLSRNMRPICRKLRNALTIMVDCRDVMREWARILDLLPPPLDGK